jgi:dihydropteroate synthase/2-amino-4-hydroxy-6-hydroxymethyldihydropteridine diphosphokinase
MLDQHTVYLALGSNLGRRAANLLRALHEVAPYFRVEATSFLYETQPAYMTDQPQFLNAVCRGGTHLAPHELLAALEVTMKEMGRVRTLRYGPRLIDLDILFYDGIQFATPDLTIPYQLLAERQFVLEPLCDIAPDLRHPASGETMRRLLDSLQLPTLTKVLPVGDQLWQWGAKSYMMGIINITPDSFSGDGLLDNPAATVAQAVARAKRLADEGADCLDVGGISTRPGHLLIAVEEEIARVTPVIQALAQEVNLPISIDTFRSQVAQAALTAGAHMINDIWGLRFDAELARLAAQSGVPLVVMHNRMEPTDPAYRRQVMHRPFGPANHYHDVIADLGAELEESLALAASCGVPRWLLLVDPGIGFGKSLEQQLELMDRLDEVKALGYPLLFGASRKSFIGRVLGGLPVEERLEGTLAANVLAIVRGADILRVHDVQAMSRAARITDALVRRANHRV